MVADPAIDRLQHEIEEKGVLTIARRQPMAIDLRQIVGALRVANDLERIGDLAKFRQDHLLLALDMLFLEVRRAAKKNLKATPL